LPPPDTEPLRIGGIQRVLEILQQLLHPFHPREPVIVVTATRT
jgi:hypothetical protein